MSVPQLRKYARDIGVPLNQVTNLNGEGAFKQAIIKWKRGMAVVPETEQLAKMDLKQLWEMAEGLQMPVEMVTHKNHVESWRHALSSWDRIKANIKPVHQLKIYRGTDNHVRWGPSLNNIIDQIKDFIQDETHKNEIIYINLKFKQEKDKSKAKQK